MHGGKPRRKTALSSLALTTGTPLMLEIHQSLMLYICRRLADPATRHLHFELSDSTVKASGQWRGHARPAAALQCGRGCSGLPCRLCPGEERCSPELLLFLSPLQGEGELKILSRLLHAGQPGDGADGGPAGGAGGPGTVESHLVVGGDSDLLLMALISGQPNVWVLSDQEGRGAAPELLARSSAFSCNAVAAAWQRAAHLPEAPDQASASLLASSLALDLALLAIMSSGNDYLPGMPVRGRCCGRSGSVAGVCGAGRPVVPGPGIPRRGPWPPAPRPLPRRRACS